METFYTRRLGRLLYSLLVLPFFSCKFNYVLLYSRALKIIEPYFEEMILNEQNALGTSEGCTKFLKMINDEEFRNNVEKEFKEHSSSLDRWRAFKALADYTNKQVNKSRNQIQTKI